MDVSERRLLRAGEPVPLPLKTFDLLLALIQNHGRLLEKWYAFSLMSLARFDEAIAEIKRAQELDPLSLILMTNLGDIYFESRQYAASLGREVNDLLKRAGLK